MFKKFLICFTLIFLLVSCEADIIVDEDICGNIQAHDIYIDQYGYNTYILVISGQEKSVDFDTFYNTSDGEYICLDY